MEKSIKISNFSDVIYIDCNKTYDDRSIVIFDDYKLDFPKIDYDAMCQHMIDIFTTAIQKSQTRNLQDFVIICYLNEKRKNSINMKSMYQLLTIMKTLFKDNLYKCVFINCNKYFKMTFKLITPILDISIRKRILFSNLTDIDNQLTNLKE